MLFGAGSYSTAVQITTVRFAQTAAEETMYLRPAATILSLVYKCVAEAISSSDGTWKKNNFLISKLRHDSDIHRTIAAAPPVKERKRGNFRGPIRRKQRRKKDASTALRKAKTCDPVRSSEQPDVGILSAQVSGCPEEYSCVPSTESATGGICVAVESEMPVRYLEENTNATKSRDFCECIFYGRLQPKRTHVGILR